MRAPKLFIRSKCYQVGGLIGHNDGGDVNNCYTSGTVFSQTFSTGNYIGGLIGKNGDLNKTGSITNCRSNYTVFEGDNVGGLIGGNFGYNVSGCYADGNVSGYSNVGGLIGSNNIICIIENCHATGNVYGKGEYSGGLIGHDYGSSIANCYASGDITGDQNSSYIGGLVGKLDCGSSIEDSYSTGKISGSGVTGGLVGYSGCNCTNCGDMPYIINSYATGNVVSEGTAGGLVGRSSGTSNPRKIVNIEKCYAKGTVSGDFYAGGLVGFTSNTDIKECFANGTVSGLDKIGGLVGSNEWHSIIENSYSNSSVFGTLTEPSSAAGGLVGHNTIYSSVLNSYSVGYIQIDGNNVGGLVGLNTLSAVSDSFWDIETSGQSEDAGGTGKTTIEMRQQATFTGWDFVNVWQIEEAIDYPKFIRQPLPCTTQIHGNLNSDCKVDFFDFIILANHWLEGV